MNKESAKASSTVTALSQSRIFRDYQQAFNTATGLKLSLQECGGPEAYASAVSGCPLIDTPGGSCQNCSKLTSRFKREATDEKPHRLQCFLGMCHAQIPVRVGDNVVAYLRAGQVFLQKPDASDMSRAAKQLIRYGSKINVKRVEDLRLHTKVVPPEVFDSTIRLLTIFADHLGRISNEVILDDDRATPRAVHQTKVYLAENYTEHVTLGDAAKMVNLSAHYFCKAFKRSTGLNFVDYLTRLRIEKAKDLLARSNSKISDAAFEVGFESLSQFNRSFKKVAGLTPSQWRNQPLSALS